MSSRKNSVKRIGMFFDGRSFQLVCKHYKEQGQDLDLGSFMKFAQHEVAKHYGYNFENYPIAVKELHIGVMPGLADDARFRDRLLDVGIRKIEKPLFRKEGGGFEEKMVDDELQNSIRTALDRKECEVIALIAGDKDFVPVVETIRKYPKPPDVFLFCWRNNEAKVGVARRLVDSVTEVFDMYQIILSQTSKNPFLSGLLRKTFAAAHKTQRPTAPAPQAFGSQALAPQVFAPRAFGSQALASQVFAPKAIAPRVLPAALHVSGGSASCPVPQRALRIGEHIPIEVCRMIEEALRECAPYADADGWVNGVHIGTRMSEKGYNLRRNNVRLKFLASQYPSVFDVDDRGAAAVMLRLRGSGEPEPVSLALRSLLEKAIPQCRQLGEDWALIARLNEHSSVKAFGLEEKGIRLAEFAASDPAFETKLSGDSLMMVRLSAAPQPGSGLPAFGAAPEPEAPALPMLSLAPAPEAAPEAAPVAALVPEAEGSDPAPLPLTQEQMEEERRARIIKAYPDRGYGFIESEWKFGNWAWNNHHFSLWTVQNKAPEELVEGLEVRFRLAYDDKRSDRFEVPIYRAVNVAAV